MPVAPQRVGALGQAVRIDAERRQQGGIADRDPAALDNPECALAGFGVEFARGGERQAACLGPRDDRRGERVLAGPFEAGCEAQQITLVEIAERGRRGEPGLAFC